MDDRKVLAKYRLEKALNCLEAAKLMFSNKYYSDSANRSYYAIFHSARAVMALDGEDRKRHSGVIAYFQEHYVRTKIFDKEFSKIIQDAFEIRQDSDYEDFFVVSHNDVKEQLKDAERFYNEVKSYIDNC